MLVGVLSGQTAAEVIRYPAVPDAVGPEATGDLVIYSSTDQEAFDPVIAGFQRAYPAVSVVYHDINTIEIYDRFLAAAGNGGPTADLLMSSAIDLQINLVNDGHAATHVLDVTRRLPRWANWRNEASGFTFEPIVIVYNKGQIAAGEVPRARYDLASLLRDQPARFAGRVATYDLERSGAGFLFATQDARESDAIWDLARRFGASGVKLYSNTAAILDRVANGRFLIGHNVVGSYAEARAASDPSIGIVLPEDYTLVMSRIAVIPKAAAEPRLARLFLDFLLSEQGQRIVAEARLFAIHPDVVGDATAAALRAAVGDSLRPIQVGPGLLVYLDQAKRERFLERWQYALAGR
ncbi:MAG: ABC transporter substrate-binding protein [Alphaproteobacteria bacterium]